MASSRRGFLTAIASLGLGGGAVGYTQRRRLRRFPDIYTLRRIRSKALPENPDPFIIPDSHLEASLTRLDELIETARKLGISEEQRDDPTIAPALRYRERALEANLSTEAESALRSGRRHTAAAIEAHQYHADEWSQADAKAEADAFATRLKETSLEYTLTPGSRLIATLHAAERAMERARNLHNRTWKGLVDDAWGTGGRIEAAHAHLDFVTAVVTDGDGESREAKLRTLANRLDAEIAESLTDADVHLGPKEISRMAIIQGGPAGLLQGSASQKIDVFPFQPASAVAIQFRNRVLATVAIEYGDDLTVERLTHEGMIAVSDIKQAKKDAIEAIEAIPEDRSSDPLGRLFHAYAVWVAEQADRDVNVVLRDANSKAHSWKHSQERAYIAYRTAAEVAQAVPAIVDRAATI